MNRLNLLFLWHMHQPYYLDPLSGQYRLPWVRLHGIKDYYDMPAMLDDFPAIRQTFNLVPSLVDQLNDYASGNAGDRFLDISLKPASDLSHEERAFILQSFFMANWDNMIRPFPRYAELLSKRGTHPNPDETWRAARYFETRDLCDLQVWFNLAWFDPMFRDTDPFLRELVRKGRDFSEAEKAMLIDKQREILARIVPKYRELQDAGRIEISATPYFHPILPLLWDSDRARECMPRAELPTRFNHPEDAREQVRRAVEFHTEMFGRAPVGMWPSEGSVSQEILGVFREHGLKWIASDEGILANSLKIRLRDDGGWLADQASLYQPYRLSNGLSMIFRDHTLSDLFGFDYYKTDARSAVEDFIGRLRHIHNTLPRDRAYAVPVILDGENAWEWYKNDGRDFFYYLYERLTNESFIECPTVSEYLEMHPPTRTIPHLFAGSWINSNYSIWIGHEEDNRAWELLRQTREDLKGFLASGSFPATAVEAAWRSIYAAEGSDWCWWYGDEHSTDTAQDFDELFRNNLIHVYNLLGKETPQALYVPVLREDRRVRVAREPRGFLTPTLDGEVTSYFEWLASGMAEIGGTGGAMHRSESMMARLYFGFDTESLYLRIDGRGTFREMDTRGLSFEIGFIRPRRMKIVVELDGLASGSLFTRDNDDYVFLKPVSCAFADMLELSCAFADLGAAERDEVCFYLSVYRGGELLERWPDRGMMTVAAPTPRFEDEIWS